MTWGLFDEEITRLAKKVDWRVDAIVGIVRGGIVPARVLAARIATQSMYCISVKKTDAERVITTSIEDDLAGRNILLVEDVLESGKSLEVVREHLEQSGAYVKTAALYVMPQTKIKPDFFLKQVITVPDFPWE